MNTTKKILVLDNYDSFTYNLVHILRELVPSEDLEVHRNDKISVDEVDTFSHIVLSPGPGLPAEAGIMPELIRTYAPTKNILGICLGHQAIAESFGGALYNLANVYHGVATPIHVIGRDQLFRDIPASFSACRYHSWAVKKENFPPSLSITAEDSDGVIMAITHNRYQIKGVQFHPESIMTPEGKKIIKNWISPI